MASKLSTNGTEVGVLVSVGGSSVKVSVGGMGVKVNASVGSVSGWINSSVTGTDGACGEAMLQEMEVNINRVNTFSNLFTPYSFFHSMNLISSMSFIGSRVSLSLRPSRL